MEKLIIKGGKSLNGTVKVDGAKNSVLCLVAAALLGNDVYRFSNTPFLLDTFNTIKILQHLGVKIESDINDKTITIDSSGLDGWSIPFEYSCTLRASVLFMAPLLVRFGKVKIGYPGGCKIGKRPINYHVSALEAMGAVVTFSGDGVEDGIIEAHLTNDRFLAADVDLKSSVGASQQIIMAATMARGNTIIRNCAKDPEVVDMTNFLIKMGARISWRDETTLLIQGVEMLSSVGLLEHEIIPDRIETSTFMIAAAITRGNIFIENGVYHHNETTISHLKQMGVTIIQERKGIHVLGKSSSDTLSPLNVTTLAYPGFPTDIQQPMTIIQLMAQGKSVVKETLYENRFKHMDELKKMNAQFSVSSDGTELVIYGGNKLTGTQVVAQDLRGCSALVLAALISEGVTIVSNLEYLDRGYYQFHTKLCSLGADIQRINDSMHTIQCHHI
ncbi:hypothetical protein CYY_007048 [Polysphondylium violaceum]|uniref:UDP-N-acetylglucosamine 1-carboxyvinyltransferase n=1 Tax=Polysphondylium violaceum TaxID=133409 RepID=A0A8J4UXW9_9MYCE|nr:hypothetical protein CYY_007048 [Polysphondylium violaceum]